MGHQLCVAQPVVGARGLDATAGGHAGWSSWAHALDERARQQSARDPTSETRVPRVRIRMFVCECVCVCVDVTRGGAIRRATVGGSVVAVAGWLRPVRTVLWDVVERSSLRVLYLWIELVCICLCVSSVLCGPCRVSRPRGSWVVAPHPDHSAHSRLTWSWTRRRAAPGEFMGTLIKVLCTHDRLRAFLYLNGHPCILSVVPTRSTSHRLCPHHLCASFPSARAIASAGQRVLDGANRLWQPRLILDLVGVVMQRHIPVDGELG